MFSASFKKVSLCTIFLAFSLPAATHAQSLGSLLKTLQQATSSDTTGVLKSLSETLQGQVAPGTSAENAEGKVVLYRTSWCGYCKRAAAYMQRKNIPFVERDIDANANYKAEYKKLGGTGGVPFIVFGQKTIYGFSEAAFDKSYADFQVAQAATPPANASQAPDPAKGHAGGIQAGQTMIPKISGIKVYTQSDKSAEKLVVLAKTDEVIYMGEKSATACTG